MAQNKKGRDSRGKAPRKTKGAEPTREKPKDQAYFEETRGRTGHLGADVFEAEQQDGQRTAVGRFRPRVVVYLPRTNVATRTQIIDSLNGHLSDSAAEVRSVAKLRENIETRPMGPVIAVVVNEAAIEEDSSILDAARTQGLEAVVLVDQERLFAFATGTYSAQLSYVAKFARLFPSGQERKLFAKFVLDGPETFAKYLAHCKGDQRTAVRTALGGNETPAADIFMNAFEAEMRRLQPTRRAPVLGSGDFQRPSTRPPTQYEHHQPARNPFGEINYGARGLDLLS